MRKLVGVLFIVAIGLALFVFAGSLAPEGSFLNEIADGIRDLVRAIGDSIAGSVRGVA